MGVWKIRHSNFYGSDVICKYIIVWFKKHSIIISFFSYITYYDAMNSKGLKYKPVKLYLKDIVLDPMPNFSSTQLYAYFQMTQRGCRETGVSYYIFVF